MKRCLPGVPRSRQPRRSAGPWVLRGALITGQCLALSLALPGCRAPLAAVVDDAARALLKHAPEIAPATTRRVAVVGQSVAGNQAVPTATLHALWDHLDQWLVNRSGTTGVSPTLVRQTLASLGLEASALHALEPRTRFVTALGQEAQAPELLVLLELAAQPKTGPGVRPPTYMLTLELLEVATGARLGKESALLVLDRYR